MFSSTMHFRHCSMSIRGLCSVCARKTFPTPSLCHHLPALLLQHQMAPVTSHLIRSDHHPNKTWIHPTRQLFFHTPQESRFDAPVLILFSCATVTGFSPIMFLAVVAHLRPESLVSHAF